MHTTNLYPGMIELQINASYSSPASTAISRLRMPGMTTRKTSQIDSPWESFLIDVTGTGETDKATK